MDHSKVAKETLDFIGGKSNLLEVNHCMTRLRIRVDKPSVLKNESIKSLEALDGVQKVITRGNDVQVVIGTEVHEVYEEFLKLNDTNTENVEEMNVKIEEKAEMNKKEEENKEGAKGLFSKFISTISECITPILPALVASGLFSAIFAVIRTYELIDPATTTYQILAAFASAPLYFLPFFLAMSSAKRFNVNPYISMTVAALLLFPNLTTLLASGNPIDFLGITVKPVAYAQSLIPILLIVWVQSLIEARLNKIIPNALKLILLPFLEFAILGVLGLLILGPVAGLITDGIAAVLVPLSTSYPWLLTTILGGLNVVIVGAGIHHGILPIAITNFSLFGYDNVIGPAMFATVFAVVGSCLGLAIRTKNSKTKELSFSTGITALMGITEPAIYSVLLLNRKALIATMIGGAAGGLTMGLLGVRVWALGSKGIPGLILLVGPEFLYGCLANVVALVVAFAISYSLGDQKKAVNK